MVYGDEVGLVLRIWRILNCDDFDDEDFLKDEDYVNDDFEIGFFFRSIGVVIYNKLVDWKCCCIIIIVGFVFFGVWLLVFGLVIF